MYKKLDEEKVVVEWVLTKWYEKTALVLGWIYIVLFGLGMAAAILGMVD